MENKFSVLDVIIYTYTTTSSAMDTSVSFLRDKAAGA
jgi:hypothetical protein